MAVKQLLIYFQNQISNVPAIAVLVANDSNTPEGFQGTQLASLDRLFRKFWTVASHICKLFPISTSRISARFCPSMDQQTAVMAKFGQRGGVSTGTWPCEIARCTGQMFPSLHVLFRQVCGAIYNISGENQQLHPSHIEWENSLKCKSKQLNHQQLPKQLILLINFEILAILNANVAHDESYRWLMIDKHKSQLHLNSKVNKTYMLMVWINKKNGFGLKRKMCLCVHVKQYYLEKKNNANQSSSTINNSQMN